MMRWRLYNRTIDNSAKELKRNMFFTINVKTNIFSLDSAEKMAIDASHFGIYGKKKKSSKKRVSYKFNPNLSFLLEMLRL